MPRGTAAGECARSNAVLYDRAWISSPLRTVPRLLPKCFNNSSCSYQNPPLTTDHSSPTSPTSSTSKRTICFRWSLQTVRLHLGVSCERHGNAHDTPVSSGHTKHRVVDPCTSDMQLSRPRSSAGNQRVEQFAGDSCWLCGKWKPFKFCWSAPRSGPIGKKVLLRTSFDNWRPYDMSLRDDGVWELDRMVPTSKFFFLFEVDGILRAARDEVRAGASKGALAPACVT